MKCDIITCNFSLCAWAAASSVILLKLHWNETLHSSKQASRAHIRILKFGWLYIYLFYNCILNYIIIQHYIYLFLFYTTLGYKLFHLHSLRMALEAVVVLLLLVEQDPVWYHFEDYSSTLYMCSIYSLVYSSFIWQVHRSKYDWNKISKNSEQGPFPYIPFFRLFTLLKWYAYQLWDYFRR